MEETRYYQDEALQILQDMAKVRISGTEDELSCAEYIQQACKKLGSSAYLEAFPVEMCTIHEATLTIDGEEIPCKGYRCCGSAEVEAPFLYLPGTDKASLSQCKGKIVLIDTGVSYWNFRDLCENGAVGIISYDGNANYCDEDIDLKELRRHVRGDKTLPCVNINAKTAIRLVNSDSKTAKIKIRMDVYEGESHNVIMDLPGETDEMIVLTAHYDSTPLSQGVYDNLSGCAGLLGVARHFISHPHRYHLRFVFCGCEERGLLGSKAYALAHEAELPKTLLNINLDMIGSIMGKFIACCSAEEKLVHYIQYFAAEMGFGISAKQGAYPSDSTPLADKGVPSLSFARSAPLHTATIHNRYDTNLVMKESHMLKDIAFITAFTDRMANAAYCPVSREIPDNVKDMLDIYLGRKRDPKLL